jgi:hypothetical protein
MYDIPEHLEVRTVPGRGRGVFTKKRIKQGEPVIPSLPITANLNIYTGLSLLWFDHPNA